MLFASLAGADATKNKNPAIARGAFSRKREKKNYFFFAFLAAFFLPPFLAAFFLPAFLAAFFLAGLAAFFVAFFAMVFIVLKTYLRRSKKILVHEKNYQHCIYQHGFVEKDD
jgi:hypothetical protein